MQPRYSFAFLSMGAMAWALVSSPLNERAIDGACSTPYGTGTCQNTSDCTDTGFNLAGYCPSDPNGVQCCVEQTCSTSSGDGTCLNTDDACDGSFVPGACPGPNSIQCCVPASGDDPNAGPDEVDDSIVDTTTGSEEDDTVSTLSVTQGTCIVAKAREKIGTPYKYGAGTCRGPEGGHFDCSGLTRYCVAKCTGKCLPHSSQQQYNTSKGKHIVRSKAKPGDLVFWGVHSNGNCKTGVKHVGVISKKGHYISAPHTGAKVKEQKLWSGHKGLYLCDDVVRFW